DRLVPLLSPDEQADAVAGQVLVIPGDRVGQLGDLRVVAKAVTSAKGERDVVVVAAPTRAMEESVEKVRFVPAVASPWMVAGRGRFPWRVVGWSLRPGGELRRGAAAFSAGGRRFGRLPVPDGDDEVSRLAVTLNDMLGRIDASRASQ